MAAHVNRDDNSSRISLVNGVTAEVDFGARSFTGKALFPWRCIIRLFWQTSFLDVEERERE